MNSKFVTTFTSLLLFNISMQTIAHADQMWEVSTSFQLNGGMSFQMPAQTSQVCVTPQQQADEVGMRTNKNCDVSDLHRTSSSVDFHLSCHGKQPLSGDGSIHWNGHDSYHGIVHTTGDMGNSGQASTATIQFDGHKVADNCDANNNNNNNNNNNSNNNANTSNPYSNMPNTGNNNPFAGIMQRESAMVGAAMDQQCQTSLDKWDLPTPFIGANAYCGQQATDYCKAVTNVLHGMDASKLAQISKDHPHWQQAGKACGIDTDTMSQQLCTTAKSNNDWAGVAGACPDAETLAIAHCTGDNYTAITTGSYGALCRAFPNDIKVTPSASTTVSNAATTVLNGVDRLRSLFGH